MNSQIVGIGRVAAITLVAGSLASAAPAPVKGRPAASRQVNLVEKFKRLDVNGPDGFLNVAEYSKGAANPQKAAAEFKKKDANHDGKLTPREFGIGGPKKPKQKRQPA